MRQIINFNLDWKYSNQNHQNFQNPTFDDSCFDDVYLPHTNKELPLHYFSDTEFCFISNYRKKVVIKKEVGKTYRLVFEGISNYAELYVNGKFVNSHKCAYTNFECDITAFIVDGKNVIAVLVDSNERPDVPPFGSG